MPPIFSKFQDQTTLIARHFLAKKLERDSWSNRIMLTVKIYFHGVTSRVMTLIPKTSHMITGTCEDILILLCVNLFRDWFLEQAALYPGIIWIFADYLHILMESGSVSLPSFINKGGLDEYKHVGSISHCHCVSFKYLFHIWFFQVYKQWFSCLPGS